MEFSRLKTCLMKNEFYAIKELIQNRKLKYFFFRLAFSNYVKNNKNYD